MLTAVMWCCVFYLSWV